MFTEAMDIELGDTLLSALRGLFSQVQKLAMTSTTTALAAEGGAGGSALVGRRWHDVRHGGC